MPKLTKRAVEALPVEAKDYFVWDSQIAGFGVRVMPSGAKTYQAQYRKGGRTRRVSIGRHGKITVDEARKLAKELMGQVAKGENPAEEIAQHRRAPTVAALCERFFDTHVKERCKPSTQGEYRRAIDLFIVPAIGSFKLVDVERKDIAELHHKYRDKPYQANRTLGVLSKMFNLAEIWGLRPDGSNPCRHVPKYREQKRERFLSQDELQRLGQALSEAEQDGSESPFIMAAFRLLILTGCRLGEIQTLQWSFITDAGMELPDTKTGARRIPLPQAARAVLSALPRLADNPYVIAGAVPGHYRFEGHRLLDGILIQFVAEDIDARVSISSEYEGIVDLLPPTDIYVAGILRRYQNNKRVELVTSPCPTFYSISPLEQADLLKCFAEGACE